MPENNAAHRGRRSIRLRGWDYRRRGAYFVTLVTHNRQHLLGEVVDGEMVLSDLGRIVVEEWERTAEMRPYIRLDAFVVMPNHVHGIIWIVDDVPDGGDPHRCRGNDRRHGNDHCRRRGDLQVAPTTTTTTTTETGGRPRGPRSGSIGAIIAGFKSAATKRINPLRGTPGAPVWQRNYYERIIRDERELQATRRHILANPARWHLDRENPKRGNGR